MEVVMIDKNKVNRNFSKGADTYDKAAIIQKYMADKIEIFINGSKKNYKILEIGCGTGIFSKKILNSFTNSRVDFLDISPGMLEKAKEKLGEEERIRYILNDIEQHQPEEKYDIIFSNATFQWIENQENLFRHLYSILDFGGKIVFSTFGKKTYCELRESFKSIDGNLCFSQDFITSKTLKEIVEENFMVLVSDEEYMIESYPDVITFLKMIRNIGANSAMGGDQYLTKGRLVKLEDIYMSKYGDGTKIDVTNHLIYMVLEKRIESKRGV